MVNTASEIAGALYRSGCLKFGIFHIKSGAVSPYYIDLTRLLSSPKDHCILVDIAADKIRQLGTKIRIDKLASIELKGALILPSIACRTNLPCTVVRKEEKVYGAVGRIAGAEVVGGERILFFDDVISEGLSKLEGIKPLEQLGARVEDILVVVDREQHGAENLEKLGYRVHALAKVTELVDRLLRNSKISNEQADAIFNYVKSA